MIPLTILIHGDYGSGKSWLAQTAPAPRLVLDAEGGAGYTYGRKVVWKNTNDAPPPAGDWETCLVHITNLKSLQTAFQWLVRGQHPFASIVIDSLSELQKRIIDEIVGTDQMRIQDWGDLFRRGEQMVRSFRDLTRNPVKPVQCVVYVTGSVERGNEETSKLRPYTQGQLGHTLPGFVDVVGYLQTVTMENGDEGRVLKLHPSKEFVAKDRTHSFPEGSLDVTWEEKKGWRNNVTTMMDRIKTAVKERGGE